MPSKRTSEKEAFVTQWVSDLADFFRYEIKDRAIEFWLHELCEWSFKPVKQNPTEEHTANFQATAWKKLAKLATQRHSYMPLIADLLEIYDEMRVELEGERDKAHVWEITKEES